jgi:hypothetical protein
MMEPPARYNHPYHGQVIEHVMSLTARIANSGPVVVETGRVAGTEER